MPENPVPPPLPPAKDDLLQLAEEAVAPYIPRFQENIQRAVSLVDLFLSAVTTPQFSQHPATPDILRAAIVLAHASLEDFLRTIAISMLPSAGVSALNHVPLAGLGGTGRPEKFLLGSLARFRGMTVDSVLIESVSEHLNRMSFNDVADIASLLRDLNVDVSKVDSTFPELQRLMQRRHEIVHQADRARVGLGTDILTPVVHADIMGWFRAILAFSQATLVQVLVPQLAAGIASPAARPPA